MYIGGIDEKEEPSALWKKQSVRRMYAVLTIFLVGFVMVAVRFYHIQIVDHEKYVDRSRAMHKKRKILEPRRGKLYDRHMMTLAVNLPQVTVAVDPKLVKNAQGFAEELSGILNLPRSVVLRACRNRKRRYIPIASDVSVDYLPRLRSLENGRLALNVRVKRRYPFGYHASQIIGRLNYKKCGVSGIEEKYDEILAGTPGYQIVLRDGRGRLRPGIDVPRVEPIDGRCLQLTIDLNYQAIAEEELRKGVERAGARAGMCIIVQPRTGEILSMANYPVADPNNSASYDSVAWKNRSVIDQFDPGSTFKIVTTSAALDLGLVDRDDRIYAEEGLLTLADGTKVRDDHPLGMITVEEALTYSSNIAMVKLARKIGARKMFEYARNFGFGVRTGIDLPVEYSGSLPTPANWDPTTLPRIAFGYGLSATALQIAMAYAAIANNGLLMTPFLVKRQLSHDRTIIEERTSEPKRQVIKSETAAVMREILESVVNKGTGKSAAIPGIRIGGKTGTAQKLINGVYTNQKHIASFVGFFPLEDPRILILVVLDEPTNGYYGSAVAAPVFRRIALRLINSTTDFTRAPSEGTTFRTSADLPLLNYSGLPSRVGLKWLRTTGFTPVLFKHRKMIYSTTPAAGADCGQGMEIQINRRETRQEAGNTVVPVVTGLPLRQAVNVLTSRGLKARVNGSGIVRGQRPEPGSVVQPGAACTLKASPMTTSLVEVARVP